MACCYVYGVTLKFHSFIHSLSYSVDEEKPSVPGGCSNEATYVQHCYTGCCVAPVSEKAGQ